MPDIPQLEAHDVDSFSDPNITFTDMTRLDESRPSFPRADVNGGEDDGSSDGNVFPAPLTGSFASHLTSCLRLSISLAEQTIDAARSPPLELGR